jgi:hypothetical protein
MIGFTLTEWQEVFGHKFYQPAYSEMFYSYSDSTMAHLDVTAEDKSSR